MDRSINCIYQKSPDIVNLLIDNNADLNARTNAGLSPLILAIIYKRIESIQLLVNNGADIYSRDQLDRSAIDLAKEYNDQEIEKILEDSL